MHVLSLRLQLSCKVIIADAFHAVFDDDKIAMFTVTLTDAVSTKRLSAVFLELVRESKYGHKWTLKAFRRIGMKTNVLCIIIIS